MKNNLQILKFQTSNAGFTLIELIVVIGIVVLLAAIFLPIGFNFYRLQIFNRINDQVIWLIKEARAGALSQKGDLNFGVHLEGDQIIAYQGNNFSERQSDLDQVYPIPSFIKFSGISDISFNPGSALPSQGGTISISYNESVKNISINSLGTIDY